MHVRAAAFCAILVAMVASPTLAQDAPPPADVVGNWDFTFDTPQGTTTWRITFEQAADSLTGKAVSSDFGTMPLWSAKLTGADLEFSVSLTFEGQSFDLYFNGTVADDTGQGSIAVPAADMPAFPYKASRVKT